MRVFHGAVMAMCCLGALSLVAADVDDDDDSPNDEHLVEAAKFAVFTEDLDLLKALLKAKVHINSPIDIPQGDTLLHLAVWAGKPDIVRFLIKQGANPLARNTYDQQPIHTLNCDRDVKVAPLIEALERPLTGFDKTMIAGVPVPAWREILGPVSIMADPLEPPPRLKPWKPKGASFIQLNDADPPKDLGPALSSRYPSWKPYSSWDNQGTIPPNRLLITVTPMKSPDIDTDERSPLMTYVKEHTLPVYSFMILPDHASGEQGYVVLIAGYWVRMGVRMFER